MRTIWHNGEFKPESEAVLSIYDMGSMYSYVFEMTRTFKRKHFKLDEHLQRLFNSLRYFEMEPGYSLKELSMVCDQLVVENDSFNEDDEHRLIINAYGGVLDTYREIEGTVSGTHIMITDIPLRWTVRGMGKLYDSGINMVTVNQKVIPDHVLDNRVKHHCRLHLLKANLEAAKQAGNTNWPILTDEVGRLCEFPGANLFIVKKNTIQTPPVRNVLGGISRQYVMNLTFTGDYAERDIMPYDVLGADEAFATATPFCVIPITHYNGIPIGDGCPGKITKSILNKWSNNVDVDIVAQIKAWNEKDIGDAGRTPYNLKRT